MITPTASARDAVDLHGLLEVVLKALAGEAAQRRVELILQARARHCMVHADWHELQQALLHLLLDAMAAMEGTHFAWRRVLVATQDSEEGVELRIKDRGHALALSRLAAAIVRTQGGRLELLPRPGGGNVVQLLLPGHPQRARALPAPAWGGGTLKSRWAALA
jgi:hypothetical protein